MKGLFAVAAAALLTTGCAQGLYPGLYAPRTPVMVRPRATTPVPVSPVGRWDEVMRLPVRSHVEVLTMDGLNAGALARADGREIRIDVGGQELAIARDDVMRVDLVDLPGSEAGAVAKRAARGALLGAGAAGLVSWVFGDQAWPPPGVLVRAGVAGGAVAGGQTALIQRQGRIVYLAPRQTSPAATQSDTRPAAKGGASLPESEKGSPVAGIVRAKTPDAPQWTVPNPVKIVK
jgi:hypothetical protein